MNKPSLPLTSLPLTVSLDGRESVRFQHGAALRIDVLEGAAWLTQTGDTDDYVLNARNPAWVSTKGDVMISSLRPSRVRISQAPHKAATNRWRDQLTGFFGAAKPVLQYDPEPACALQA